ncbi:MAG: Bifunctional protein FolD protein [Chlamydiia bacterium]|nr:Bifunctional protein FolD protein [Chlamydiia bacterium]
MNIIDGKAIAAKRRKHLTEKISKLPRKPGLTVFLVGDDPASAAYVRMKQKACEECGLHSELIKLPKETSQEALEEMIEEKNQDDTCDGILVQLPLPKHMDSKRILNLVDPSKDVDGFHPNNVGKLLIGEEDCFVSCTPFGVLTLLEETGIEIAGKNAVVIGRSNIVGKPMATLLLRENATITIVHSQSSEIESHCRNADILIAAVGKPGFVTSAMVKPGATVIDVGINRVVEEGKSKLVGDVAYDEVKEKAGAITPVPGGVGPMTIVTLLENTYKSALARGDHH